MKRIGLFLSALLFAGAVHAASATTSGLPQDVRIIGSAAAASMTVYPGGSATWTINSGQANPLTVQPKATSTWTINSGEANPLTVQPKATSTWTINSGEANPLIVQPKATSTWTVNSGESNPLTVQPKATSTWMVVCSPLAGAVFTVKPQMSTTGGNGFVTFTGTPAGGGLADNGLETFGMWKNISVWLGITTTDTGHWIDARTYKSCNCTVDLNTTGSSSATLLAVGQNISGTDDADPGYQIGYPIIADGVYTFEPLPAFFKLRISATNAGSPFVGCIFRQ